MAWLTGCMKNTASESDRHGHGRRSRAELAALVAAFEQSWLSRAAYCRQHGLSLTSLNRYCKRREDGGRGQSVRAEQPAPAVSLIPVELVDRPAADGKGHMTLYVELCGGRRIGVGAGFDAVTLRRLIAALDEVQPC